MIHFLLMILKIIGIILLAILVILLLLLLSVLFIPIRYQVRGSWHEEPKLAANASWMLHIISFQVLYTKEGFRMALRMFGFHLFRNRGKDVAKDAEEASGTILGKEEQSLYDELMEDEERYRSEAEAGKAARESSGQESGSEIGSHSSHRGGKEDDRNQGKAGAGDHSSDRPVRWKTPVLKIRTKLKGIWDKLKLSFINIRDKLKGFREFAHDKLLWLEDGRNQASLKLIFRQAKRLIAHAWPRKGKGSVTFGFDDPYTTGQMLQAASLIYPFYHRQLCIHPVFDRQVLEAEGSFRGRIRLAAVLWLVFQIFWDKHTRNMIRGLIK